MRRLGATFGQATERFTPGACSWVSGLCREQQDVGPCSGMRVTRFRMNGSVKHPGTVEAITYGQWTASFVGRSESTEPRRVSLAGSYA